MIHLKAVIKFILFAITLASYFIVASLVNLFFLKKEKYLQYVVSFYSKVALKIFKVQVDHNVEKEKLNGSLLVSNHLSYLDIMIISSLVPTNFITSTDIERTPVLGHICKLASCIFVNRKGRDNRQEELKKIEERLLYGENIVIFPEATSTNGESVIPFKKGLFESVLQKKINITSFCIQYEKINEQKINLNNRDKVCWYGEMSFLPHLWELLKQNHISVRLDMVSQNDATTFNSRNELVNHVYKEIKDTYVPISNH